MVKLSENKSETKASSSVDKTNKAAKSITDEISNVVLGKEQTIEMLMAGVLANGNILFEDFPGLAKTLLIKTLSEAMDLNFNRIQFTPDLMPTDITGTEILEEDFH